MPAKPNLYDQVAYPGNPFAQTHPDRLATMALLHGLDPAPASRCRVLEIACNEGANLIPMAYAMPGSEFVGFDLAGQPVARAQARIAALGLTNIHIFQQDLLDAGAELGRFDYILAHGLYAWIPELVRDKLLALCGELLAENGVAFVSYNALPGSYFRMMAREMMLFAASHIEDPCERLAQSLAFMRGVFAQRPADDLHRAYFEEQAARLEKRDVSLTFHDEMAEVFLPISISDFCAHAGRHHLQYLCDAVIPPASDPCYRPEVRALLAGTAGDDAVRQEQALDFMRMRMYRETLLCRAGIAVQRDYGVARFERILIASQAVSSPGNAPGAQVFILPDGLRMQSNHPAVMALLTALEAAWPNALEFAYVRALLSGAGLLAEGEISVLLMQLAASRMVELRCWHAPLAKTLSERPRVSGYARAEVARQRSVTTLLHTITRLDDSLVRSFLELLDGTRDRTALREQMHRSYPAVPLDELEAQIDSSLHLVFRAGLLED